MKDKKFAQLLFITAGILIIAGALARIFSYRFAPPIFTTGTALLIFTYAKKAFENSKADKRQQRLDRIGLLNSLMLAVGSYFMFTGSNSWVVMVLIFALSSLFLSFRGN
jgi:uncharacterized membrane protein YphA (DoxX/SURF4 family)